MRPDDTLLGLTFLLSADRTSLFPLFFHVDSPVSGRKKEEREISEHRRFQSAQGRYEGVTRYIETGDDVSDFVFFPFLLSLILSFSPSPVLPLIREHKRPRNRTATTIPFDCLFRTTATASTTAHNVDRRTLSRVTSIKKRKGKIERTRKGGR